MDVFSDKDKYIKLRKDLIGPPLHKINLIFIDDINMPLPDDYGC